MITGQRSGPRGRNVGKRRGRRRVADVADRQLTLMAVHAHPDDEVVSTGGLLARCAAEGIQTVLVTCTDGRCGDGPGGVKPGEPGHDPAAVVAIRQRELEASCAILGVDHLELLGYADSGMVGWPTNDAPNSFWRTPIDAAAERLGQLMVHYQPDVIVTYDENGFYGHPDHIQAHRVTMAAVAATGVGEKVYWTTIPRSVMIEFNKKMRELGADWDEVDTNPDGHEVEIGLPDDQITSWVDVSTFAGAKYDALAAHASQSENGIFLKMGREKFSDFMGIETFVRVRDRSGAPAREDDLFASLR
jgi:LmbE family N-acetylglucosaminyl deacetylase